MATTFWIQKEGARTSITRLLQAAKALYPANAEVAGFQIDTNAGDRHFQKDNLNCSPDKVLEVPEVAKVVEWLESGPIAQLNHVMVRCGNAPIAGFRLAINRKPLHDQITLHYDDNADRNVVADLITKVSKLYEIVPNERVVTESAVNDIAVRRDLVTQLVQSFSEASARLHESITTGTETLLLQATRASEELAKQVAKERGTLHAEYDTKRKSLSEERAAFELERKEFNDKKATLVRRDLLEKIRAELRDHGRAFTLSAATYRKRRPILVLFWIIIPISLVSFIVFGWRVFTSATPDWHHVGPFTGAALTLVSTILFYVRWQTSWLGRHADLETKNQLFNYDMLRASWFAEMLFEYKDERGQGLPESVIEVMTANLFQDTGARPMGQHPVDDVIGLIGKLRRVRVSDKEVELEGGSGRK